MIKLKAARILRLSTVPILCAVLLLSACEQKTKFEQVQDGIENVDAYAQEIEDQAK